MTYNGQGVNEKGVKAKHHAVIYTGKKPVTFEGEKSKGLKAPIKMVPLSSRHKLDNASRLNYAKLYTVEYNVQVWFIGEIHPDFISQVVSDFNSVHSPLIALSHAAIPEEFEYDDSSKAPLHDYSTPKRDVTMHDKESQGFYGPAFDSSGDSALSAKPVEVITETSDQLRTAGYDPNQLKLESTSFPQQVHDLKDRRVPESAELSDGYEMKPSPNTPLPPNPLFSQNSHTLYKSSSLSSLESVESVFSMKSQVSTFSTATDVDYGERLENLFFQDPKIQLLFAEAPKRVSWDKFESNFRRCLRQFSNNLRVEASSPLMVLASRIVRSIGDDTAGSIRRELESRNLSEFADIETKSKMHHDASTAVYQHYEIDYESENSSQKAVSEDGRLEKQSQITSFTNLETESLLKSNAFQMLQENLRLFLHPNEAERAVFEAWPIKKSNSDSIELEYHIYWDLHEFLDTMVSVDQKLGSMLTLTGGSQNAQASSCKDYLQQIWKDDGLLLLNIVEKYLAGENGKSCWKALLNCSLSFSSPSTYFF